MSVPAWKRLERIAEETERGGGRALDAAVAGIPEGEVLPPAVAPFLAETAREPIATTRIPVVFSPRFVPPEEFGLREHSPLLDGRFLVVGTERAEVPFYLALDLSEKSLPVYTIDFETGEEEEERHPPRGTLPPVAVLEAVAPSFTAFLRCMAAVERHGAVPLYKTPPRSVHEDALKKELEAVLGRSLAGTWWIGRLTQGTHDFFWNQFLGGKQRERPYKETVAAETDRGEAVFGLFSLSLHKKVTCIRYFGILEDENALPLLFDLLAVEEDPAVREEIVTAISCMRSRAVPYLDHVLDSYPSARGRAHAFALVRELNYTRGAERMLHAAEDESAHPYERWHAERVLADAEEWLTEDTPEAARLRERIAARRAPGGGDTPPPPPPDTFPVIYPVTLPPFDLETLHRMRSLGFLVVVCAALLGAAAFYLFTHNTLSALLGGCAVGVVSVFLPDASEFLLKRKLASRGFLDRLIGIREILAELERENVARCIEYAADDYSLSLGYLFYLASELREGEYRPRIFFCNPERYADTVSAWYEEGLIPADGLRSPRIRAYWKTMREKG